MTKIVDRVPHMQEGAKIQSVSWIWKILQMYWVQFKGADKSYT